MGEIENSLENAIRSAIEDDGWTEYAIAKAAKVEQRTINRWLKGERTINLATADKLAEWLSMRLTKAKIPKRPE